ncbi:hypothetical protein BGW41_007243 [Actinomortierella wolfii]|nr:hypothetical protein BGW41_007243 [Actinomortierella wolfii]
MRFTRTTFAFLALSALAVLSQAALTKEEEESHIAKGGPNANLCAPCLEKAMNNHFPHACTKDINYEAANTRPSGATPTEERCVCLAFQDLYWMKADCSKECLFVHQPKAMARFLPASKIDGCDKWIDFKTGQEKEVEGFPPKDLNHTPEVFAIVEPPPEAFEGVDDEGRNYDINAHVTFADDKKKQSKAAQVEDKNTETKEDKATQEQEQKQEQKQETQEEVKKESKREQKEEL